MEKTFKNITDINNVKNLLQESVDLIILSHINPDGDSIGSTTALHQVFKKLHFNVKSFVPNDIPEFLKWLPSCNEIIRIDLNNFEFKNSLLKSNIIFCLDFNDFNRIKNIKDLIIQTQAKKILIDHHPYPSNDFEYIFSMTDVSSTAELVYYFIKSMGWANLIDRDIATSIYSGIMTDTGCFAYNASYPHTHYVVAKLLEYNINREKIYSNVYDNFSESRMRLLGYTLFKNLKVYPEYRTAIIYVTKEEQEYFNFQPGDSEGFVNYPLSIKNIVLSVLFVEKKDHIRLSLRSKGNFPVNSFAAKHFNGGGHPNAAGGESYLNIEETLKKFESVLKEYKTELNSIKL